MRKAMHADPDNYVTSMAPGQYWTWGTHMRGMKGKKIWYCNPFSLYIYLDAFTICLHDIRAGLKFNHYALFSFAAELFLCFMSLFIV